MTAFLVLLLIVIVGGVGFAIGLAKGRRGASSDASSMPDQAAYQAGYLAGHLVGWRDAEAKVQGTDRASTSTIIPSPMSPPLAPPYSHSPTGLPAQHPVPEPAVPHPLPNQAQYFQPPTAQPVSQAVPYSARKAVPPQPVPQQSGLQQPVAQSQARFLAQQPPVVRETPEAAAARKAKRDQQNINVTLYVASLLLVAAGALFVGTSLPALFRFVGIWFITALFYVSGMVIHSRVPRLRPAAVAFVGTGLALIPVTGLPCTTSFSTMVLLPGWSRRCWARPFMRTQQ